MGNQSLFVLFYRFLRGTAFKKGEWDIESSSFDPVRLILYGVSVGYLVFSLGYVFKTVRLHRYIDDLCPSLIESAVLADDSGEFSLHNEISHTVHHKDVLTKCHITVELIKTSDLQK